MMLGDVEGIWYEFSLILSKGGVLPLLVLRRAGKQCFSAVGLIMAGTASVVLLHVFC